MNFRMVTLRRAPNGDWFARKAIPADLQDDYKKAHGRALEERFRAAATLSPSQAKQELRDWDATVSGRIEAIRAAHKGEGRSLTKRDLSNHRRGGTVTQADIELIRTFAVVPIRDDHNFRITSALFQKARHVSGVGVLVPANYWGAAVYSPLAYVTPAVAMLTADALGLGRLDSFYAGRAANTLLFIAAVAFAIWIAPTGRPALAFIFLLPMSLFEAASFSADALAYALSAIVGALLARIGSGFSSRLV
jgi:hypothetical protein